MKHKNIENWFLKFNGKKIFEFSCLDANYLNIKKPLAFKWNYLNIKKPLALKSKNKTVVSLKFNEFEIFNKKTTFFR